MVLKKVLIIGPAYFEYNQSIAAAFDSNKFDLRIIDYSDQFGQINLNNKLLYFISQNRIKTTQKLLAKFNSVIIRAYHRFRPDIVLIIKGDVVNEKTVLEMNGSKNILWLLDGIYNQPNSVKLVDKVSTVFLFEKSEVEKVKRINNNTFHLPSAFDDQIFKNLHLKKDIDLLFIGTLYESRIKLFEKLHNKFPKLNIKVYCKRYWFYKTPLKYLNSIKDNIFINRFVTPSEANILYNRSKMCINMHHEQSVYGVNPRFFEILGAGALQFVDHKPFIEEFFPNGNIRTYKNEEELFEMISQRLKENETQDERTLYDTVIENHTYRNRVEYILDRI